MEKYAWVLIFAYITYAIWFRTLTFLFSYVLRIGYHDTLNIIPLSILYKNV